MQPYVPPKRSEDAFNCPHCGAFAHQEWVDLLFDGGTRIEGYPLLPGKDYSRDYSYDDLQLSVCIRCHEHAVWHKDRLVYPMIQGVQPPNADMQKDIQDDYREAASIVQLSPRGAAA